MSLTQIRLNNKVKNPRNFEFYQELKNVTNAAKTEAMYNAKVAEYNQSLQGLYNSLKPQLEVKNKIQEDATSLSNLDKGRFTNSDMEKETEEKEVTEAAKKNEKITANQ